MKKKVIALVAVAALLTAAAIGGTLAFFTDTDSATNRFTSTRGGDDPTGGLVDITLVENFEQGTQIKPGPQNAVTKEVTIRNEADSEEAYVFYTYAIPQVLDGDILTVEFSDSDVWGAPSLLGTQTVDGIVYNVYLSIYEDAVAPGATTDIAMKDVYMSARVDAHKNDAGDLIYTLDGVDIDYDFTDGINILVNAYAIQTDGFADAAEAYLAYVGEDGPGALIP